MYCNTCGDKACIKTGKPCTKVEKYLQSLGIRGVKWIRPLMPSNKRKGGKYREIPFSTLGLDNDHLTTGPIY
jgi:hypothetical protein